MNKTRHARILDLIQLLSPSHVDLRDDSHKHAHHIEHLGSSAGTGETHFYLLIVSEKFQGLSRIDRQRMVNDLLANEFKNGLHALQMKLFSTEEYNIVLK